MPIKKCVGVVLYNDDGKIFLMGSPKWKWWIVPGGKIEEAFKLPLMDATKGLLKKYIEWKSKN